MAITSQDPLSADNLGWTGRGSGHERSPRLLVVDGGEGEPVTGAEAATRLVRLLPGVDVALLQARELGLDKAPCPSETVLLGKYHLILVTTEDLRQRLCASMPGLSERVYRLDHFIVPTAYAPRPQDPLANGCGDDHALADGIGHWSTCISHWLAACFGPGHHGLRVRTTDPSVFNAPARSSG